MITTVTLNAAIDKTYIVPSLQVERVNRVRRMYSEPGGKGINVAKVLHRLQQPVVATGFVGGFNGKLICSRLGEMGIEHQFVHVAEESRLCLNVIDESRGVETEILEYGPTVHFTEWEQLKERIDRLAAVSEIVVLSGSLPRGLSDDAYAQLIRLIHRHGAKPIVDTSGSALEKCMQEKPFMIKPNRNEFANLMKTDAMQEHDILEALKRWGEKHIPLIVVSLGSEGAFVAYHGAFYKVTPPAIAAVNSVGSGDAMVAGIAAGLASGFDIETTLTLATAAAAANALEQRAGCISVDKVNLLKELVHVKRL